MWKLLISTDMVNLTISISMPILVTAIGATFNERAGVINIGLEGIMIWGAWAAIYFTDVTGNMWLGLLGALLFGFLISLLHAVFTITFKAEQIVTGVAVNLLALAMTEVLSQLHWESLEAWDIDKSFDSIDLLDIPVLGVVFKYLSLETYIDDPLFDPVQVLNNHNILVYFGLLLIPFCHILLFHTPFGLRIRVIGEHPQAAATAGISVKRYQYIAVIISGILSGFGGAILGFQVALFNSDMTGGRGFTALAAMIFGKWTVLGSAFAALFFGYFFSLQLKLQTVIRGIGIPVPILQMFPPVVAIMTLAGFIGRARPPKAIGQAYDPTEEG
jgi:simple sugar transport system permease protein